MWRELISELTRDIEPIHGIDPGPDFFPGATPEQLDEVERALGTRLPERLRDILGESNGVFVVFGQRLIWTTDEIIEYNRAMRAEPGYRKRYAPFDDLL